MDQADGAVDTNDGTEGPDEFLERLGEALLRQENVDVGLAEILRTYLLTASPANDAVARAKTDIVKLATDRANPPDLESSHG